MSQKAAPNHILIVGGGVFGLSTGLSLLSRPHYASARITIIDASPTLPSPTGSSVDASRIVRADYSNPIYSRLAAEAQVLWRDTSDSGWGGQGRYQEPGFLLSADDSEERRSFVRDCMNTARAAVKQTETQGWASKPIEALGDEEAIKKASGYAYASGSMGYVNWNSGWSDAEKSVVYALERLKREGKGRVELRAGAEVQRLLVERTSCVGVRLRDGDEIRADLTVCAAGAWTPRLVNLQGHCLATGQVLTYIDISENEERAFDGRPTVINMSRGMFVIPPRANQLKVARHGFGYRNMRAVPADSMVGGPISGTVQVSIPRVDTEVPVEGQVACRKALREWLPNMAERPFVKTRICWYCDTPNGDFLIAPYPETEGLFIATGGSGHGFKFFPVIGERIVDAIEGTLDPQLREAWRFKDPVPDFTTCDDGSRSGPKGMLLDDELARSEETRSRFSKL
jgi:sarcosine oxidase / L-pipecolate oxidase